MEKDDVKNEGKEAVLHQSNPIRKVMIGTPSIDGKLDVWYTISLLQTMQLCAMNGIQVIPIFLSYDSLVQRARNDLVFIALDMQVDDLIFIDADMEWNPQAVLRILSHKVDLVAGTARKKTDDAELYVVKILKGTSILTIDDNGLIEVEGVGMGFTRLSKSALIKLWNAAPKYIEDSGNEKRMIFNVSINGDGFLTSEDTCMCDLWRSLKEKVWFDYKITCNHIGVKKYVGNFEGWLNKQIRIKQN